MDYRVLRMQARFYSSETCSKHAFQYTKPNNIEIQFRNQREDPWSSIEDHRGEGASNRRFFGESKSVTLNHRIHVLGFTFFEHELFAF